MKTQHLTPLLVVFVCALLGPLARAQDRPLNLPVDPNEAVLALLQEDLDAQRSANPLGATLRGDRRFDTLLPDVSPEAIAARQVETRVRIARLITAVRGNEGELTPENLLNAQLLEFELRRRLNLSQFPTHQLAADQLNGPHIWLPQTAGRLTMTTDQHRRDYVERLRALPAYLEQVAANMRDGLEAGRTPPKVVMGAVSSQAASHAHERYLEDPRSHAMFTPLRTLAPEHPIAREAEAAIREGVVPAFAAFARFIEEEYVPGCRDTVALSDGPDGREYYDALVRSYTTTRLSAEEIHEIGLDEVSRIRAEMFEVIARSDFERKDELSGDALFDAFVERLRTDPRFYHESPDALLAGYRDIAKRVDAEMPRLFGHLPRLSYGVREMPAFMAPSAPTAYYMPGSLPNGVPGIFIANTYRLDQRPKYEMIALTLHEAVPGHHHQIAIAQELEDAGLHEWRTELGYGAFVEGWALYSERLGLEMGDRPIDQGGRGLYEDPYDDFGRLSYEMWRALRLVVDPGMHALGWSRERAIEFMLANSALTRANIVAEVERYIAMPGQACGYKIGELRIRALRERAERELGDRFDLRGFHDAVLIAGALPLDVLEARIGAWIETQRAG